MVKRIFAPKYKREREQYENGLRLANKEFNDQNRTRWDYIDCMEFTFRYERDGSDSNFVDTPAGYGGEVESPKYKVRILEATYNGEVIPRLSYGSAGLEDLRDYALELHPDSEVVTYPDVNHFGHGDSGDKLFSPESVKRAQHVDERFKGRSFFRSTLYVYNVIEGDNFYDIEFPERPQGLRRCDCRDCRESRGENQNRKASALYPTDGLRDTIKEYNTFGFINEGESEALSPSEVFFGAYSEYDPDDWEHVVDMELEDTISVFDYIDDMEQKEGGDVQESGPFPVS